MATGETRVRDNEGSIDPELGHEETTMFRAVAARLIYLSQDWPDIAFATMKLCSKMSRPDGQDLKNMKRVGRILVGMPRVGCLFEWQAHPSALHALADTDWAGDRQSRNSVSGGMILHGKHLIKAWTRQQSTVATSSVEAELYAGNRAATESTGLQAFAKDLGSAALRPPPATHTHTRSDPKITALAGHGRLLVGAFTRMTHGEGS